MTIWDNPITGLYEPALIERGPVIEVSTESAASGAIATASHRKGRGRIYSAGAGEASEAPSELCGQVRRRRAAPGSNRIRADLPRDWCEAREDSQEAALRQTGSAWPLHLLHPRLH